MCMLACVSMKRFRRCKLVMYQVYVCQKGILYLGENMNYRRHKEFSHKAISWIILLLVACRSSSTQNGRGGETSTSYCQEWILNKLVTVWNPKSLL